MLKIPVNEVKELEAIEKRFLWGDTDNSHKYHLVNWDEIKQPKKMGGLGLRSLLALKKAFHGEWVRLEILERQRQPLEKHY